MIELLLQTSVNAIYAASFMALIAVGLMLIFGVMGVINFAHGELFMLGAYCVVFVYAERDYPYFLAVVIGLIFVSLLGILMQQALFKPVRNNPLAGLIVSIGLLLMLQAAVAMGFGVRMEHIAPSTQTTFHPFGFDGVVVALQRLYVIIAAVVVLSGLWMFLRHTRFGWALRACAQDPEAAALQGISINRASLLAMFIATAMAGLAGALAAPLVRTYPYMGHSVIVTAFIVTIVGGLGSLEGAVVAAILYGFVHTFVTTFFDGVVADIVGLLLMLLVLIARPTGLFGVRDRA